MNDEARPIDRLLDAALPHVAFDGWSEATFRAAVAGCDLDAVEARMIAPRGALDLAVAYHRRGDRAMLDALAAEDLGALKFRDRVARALELRIDALDDREAVRRASSLFTLPQNSAEGAKLVWETADHVWTVLGDTSEDVNWYTKRATLSGVWASTVLFWLGDDSPGAIDTRAFMRRRIDNVMQIEKVKAQLRENPVTKGLMSGVGALFSRVSAPNRSRSDLPGTWTRTDP